ncbi:MAG: IS1634 family transposase [Rhodococcus sp. (in: high G+C Gram-positive bacteria)]|uniref:IS1634 family transposase n=1 Tax=Rhodococcus sp. TaxID=1831 RepID=UPI003BAECC07
MYLRTITSRPRKDGSRVRYLQLAHNEWDPEAGQSKAKVIHSFGREDQVDRDALARLVRSISRMLEPEQQLTAQAGGELSFVGSAPLGGAWVLDGLWRQLGVDATLRGLLADRRIDERAERLVLAMVANRALAASSKRACAGWVDADVHIPGLGEVGDDPQPLYRAMDWLLEVEAELAEAVYWATADLLNLEVDLLFFDTTSTYFETEQADEPADGATVGFRTWGRSKDHRADLPQIVIGMAVTRGGIPVRVWCWPGNTNDSALIRQVKDDLRAWKLTRVVWVGDRGFTSAENRRYLQRAGGHYILGEKLRGGTPEADAALARQGRYHTVAGNLGVKEVVIDDATMRDRFVICRNPEAAERDRIVRDQLIETLTERITGSDALADQKRTALAAGLPAGLRRFLRTTPAGKLRIDRAAVATEERLDGKFLLRTSDPSLSAEDVALGYKQLLEVERGWRDMKSTLDLRPVYHRLEDRIRAHVLLCWLALLLIRITETRTGDTWANTRRELQRLHLGTFVGPAGTIRQRTQTTHAQRRILAALDIDEPPEFFDITPSA